jgi:hypothetical protein
MTLVDFHPLANIFPLIEGKEYAELAEDIRQHGLHEPIVLFENAILDGRNRYRACLDVGETPEFLEYDGDDPVAFVISRNLRRRHLNESQRGMVAAKLANLPKHIHKDDASIEASVSQTDAADLLNVSRSAVQRAKVVQDHGVPELTQAVERGEVAVSTAAEVATLPE